jgi:signal transduction histidine kinase
VGDTITIFALTVGCCVVAGGVGLLALRALRHRSLRWQLAVATIIPVVAVALSVAVSVKMMFLSTHDSGVIVIALATSLLLALGAVALVLRRITHGSAALGTVVSRLVDDEAGVTGRPDEQPVKLVPELERVRRELADARQTLAESRIRERNAERARRELVSFMSHDLRTPLAGLRALSEGLEDGVIADVPGAYGQLRSTVKRMTGLVEDLFELSRVEAEPDHQRTPVSLSELIGDVVDELGATAAAAGVTLCVDLPEQDRLALNGDADALARAVTNVISNAVRHTPRGGMVQVSAGRSAEGRLQVTISDGCGGIPEAHLDRVFDTGWRGTSARTGSELEGGGAGLGLAIAKGVVSAHAGSIAVQNVEGGCSFRLDLPAGQPSAA